MTLESSLDCKEIKPVNPNGNQFWIFIWRTDAEAEALILWPPNANNWLIGKDPDAGKDWRQEEKGRTEGMVGWHHWLHGHEFEQAQGVGDGQGSLACRSPWGSQKIGHDWLTELNWLIEESIVCGSTQKGSEQEGGDWRGDSNSLSFYIENSSLVLKNSHYKPLDPPIILMMTVFWLANSLGYIVIYQ